ncbi:MAG: TerB family tellurite resistance protein [Mariprofundales bacterium]
MALFGLFGSGKKKSRSYHADRSGRSSEHEAQLVRSPASERAFVSLLVRMMCEDGVVDEEEYAQVINSAMECVQLDDYAVRKIVDAALASDDVGVNRELATFMHESTEYDRSNLIQQLWNIAMADGEISDYEARLIRRAAVALKVKIKE